MLGNFSLADGVYASYLGDQLIFLSLPQDRYWTLVGNAALAGAALLSARNSRPGIELLNKNLVPAIAEELIAAGLIVRDPEGRRPLAAATERSFIGEVGDLLPHELSASSGRDLAEMALAFSKAKIRLIGRSGLKRTVAQLERRRACKSGYSDLESVRFRVARFRRLRPIFIPRTDKCLLNAVFLLEYLWLKRIRGSWIFGVRVAPFRAHCWVEWNGLLLDDDTESVGDFKPILCV
jgi:hypothetical protein